MNRIILIGNGFDLAHGYETGYKNFIDDFWRDKFSEYTDPDNPIFDNEFFNFQLINFDYEGKLNSYLSLIKGLETGKVSGEFKNEILKTISEIDHIDKWVDIENEYYNHLKSTINHKYWKKEVKKINAWFKAISDELIKYLEKVSSNSELIDTITKEKISSKMYSKLDFNDCSSTYFNKRLRLEVEKFQTNLRRKKNNSSSSVKLSELDERLFTHLNGDDPKSFSKKIRELMLSVDARAYFDLSIREVLFLNFNYTNTHTNYKNNQLANRDNSQTLSISIHGALNNKIKNPIIFGFGDELDENYKTIENLNDNHYLENIKSIKYLETENHKDLISFVDSDDFQIFIFGHSCGISDRTLLNKLFEHPNCSSIKVFYHQIDKESDNYTDVIRNISRNFNNKSMMRDRVVNKRYCKPLI